MRLERVLFPKFTPTEDGKPTNLITEFLITAGEKRKRLDQFLVHREPEISRSSLKRLIALGRIRVNSKVSKPSHMVKPGDSITMDVPQPELLEVNGKRQPVEIFFEDETLLVLNKPAGIVVHPTSGYWSGTLTSGLLSHFQQTTKGQPSIRGKVQPGFVHRLDKDTSGVMVVAKTDSAHRSLATQFQQHTITRTYEALTLGLPEKDSGEIHIAIGRDRKDSKKHSPSTKHPLDAITEYLVTHRYGTIASHIILHPRTGRTHQLRVHLTSLGVPILGDVVYGGQNVTCVAGIPIPRVMLHARTLGFQHPTSGIFQEYTVALPLDMQTVRQELTTCN